MVCISQETLGIFLLGIAIIIGLIMIFVSIEIDIK